jgi:hypothetical protein
LGPQNSAVPFNQSAVYFYMFYPVFILSDMSFLTTFITNLALHFTVIVLGYWALDKFQDKKLQLKLILVTLLASLQPQLVRQHRYVWNPSLVFVSIASSFFLFYLLKQKFTCQRLWLFAFSLAFAVAMNLSAVPAMIAFLILALVTLRKHWLKIVGALFVAGNVLFLPYWVFELRYNFQIIKRVLGRQVLTLNQSLLSPIVKLKRMSQYIIGLQPDISTWILVGLLIILTAGLIKKSEFLSKWSRYSTWLLLLTLFLMFVTPVPIESHYIFAPLAFLLIAIVGINQRTVKITIMSILLLIWLRPVQIKSYFTKAPRTYAQLESCFEYICSQETEPIFVSTQAKHPYHTGPEFRYLMIKHGCDVKHIETQTTEANKMAVVNDQSEYMHGKTAFDELTLFGEAGEVEVYECEADVRVHILARVD